VRPRAYLREHEDGALHWPNRHTTVAEVETRLAAFEVVVEVEEEGQKGGPLAVEVPSERARPDETGARVRVVPVKLEGLPIVR